MVFRRRRGRKPRATGKGLHRSFKKGKNLAQKVNTLAKIVKADHAKIVRAVDYSDWSGPSQLFNLMMPARFYIVQLMQPVHWTATRRQSNENAIQRECFINSITISTNVLNGPNVVSHINWSLWVFRAKKEWTPVSDPLVQNMPRAAVDYSSAGIGNAPILNESKFKVLKRINFSTFPGQLQGNQTSAAKRWVWKIPLKQRVVASPTINLPVDNNWKDMVTADFSYSDRLYYAIWCESPFGSFEANPPYLQMNYQVTTSTL